MRRPAKRRFERLRLIANQEDGNAFQLTEVKAKSYDSTDPKRVGLGGDIPAAMRPYIEDVAFQRFVLSGAIPGAKVSAFLLMPDKSVAVTVDGMNQLFEVSRDGSAIEVRRSPRLATDIDAAWRSEIQLYSPHLPV